MIDKNFENILQVLHQQIDELPGKYGYYRNDLFVLLDNIKTILEISKSYQYKDLSANGFCSFAKFSIIFLRFILKPNNMDKLEYDHVKKMLDLIKKNYNIFLSLNELKEKTHNANGTNDQDYTSELFFPFNAISHFYQEIFANISHSKYIMKNFANIWLSPKSRFWLNNLILIYSFFSNTPKSLNLKKQKSDGYDVILKNSTIYVPFNFIDIFDTKISRFFLRNIIYFKRNAFGKRLIIKPQTRWQIPVDSRDIIDNNSNNNTHKKESIKLRYILHRKKRLNKKLLIIYLHGSGFVCTRAEFYDNFQKQLISKSNGVAALVVDYSLKVAFPKQFQECFDTYLWATSGKPEVKEKLGFNPTDIIIISDSAGSIMGLTILFLVAKIQKLDPSYHTFLPKAFISLYGVYNATFDWCPSRFLSEFDSLLGFSTLLVMSGVLMNEQGAIDKVISENELKGDSKKYRFSLVPKTILPWYKDGDKLNIEKMQSLHKKSSSSFLNSLKGDFDSISSVHLYLMTTHYCPFLDDNISLAKLWKGTIEVDIMDNMPHGFMAMLVEKQYKNYVFSKIVKIIDNVLQTY